MTIGCVCFSANLAQLPHSAIALIKGGGGLTKQSVIGLPLPNVGEGERIPVIQLFSLSGLAGCFSRFILAAGQQFRQLGRRHITR